MDVNGTRFFLLHGVEDWGACYPQDSEQTLADLWALVEEGEQPPLEWNAASSGLRLARLAPIFRRSGETDALDIGLRRGADRDQYGHWYWINERESGVRFLATGETVSVPFWESAERDLSCEVSGDFTACPPPAPERLTLRGLAVTARHYLVVGNVTEGGILVFDLHRGGPPLSILWHVPFAPWDMAALPDGGLLILDRDNATYWVLDEHFRLLADVTTEPALFQPDDETLPENIGGRSIAPQGFPLTPPDDPEDAFDPISIEPGPDGHVLVLHTVPGQPSVVDEYDGAALVHKYRLSEAVAGIEDDLDEGELFSISAHDFAYTRCCVGLDDDCPDCLNLTVTESGAAREMHLLYFARGDGNQVIAFEMNREVYRLDAQKDYLPLRRWQGKGLVAAGGRVYYDFEGRWVPLQVFVDCRYAQRAVLTTHAEFVPGQQFDSGIPGCVWHRLLLDAIIPAGTAVLIQARAADDTELLAQSGWVTQPRPYRRSDGAELPFYAPVQADPDNDRAGTWELLFQGITGRYVQIEITLEGSGRSTPELYNLRAWYPRFSYLEHYLPAIYREDPESASFLDRWLANYEGFYTSLEDQIDRLSALLDPRTAPAESLDWLAHWFGLALDPLWSEDRRRFFIRHAYELYSRRGTLPGMEIALRIYLDETLGDWLFEPECWGGSSVRIIEAFLTRDAGGAAVGDPTATGGRDPQDTAHRFTVLVPHNLTDEQFGMVERLVQMEKPAHAAFEIKRYWDLFRVGEARVGLDTQLGESSFIDPAVLGESTLPGMYLESPYPFNIRNRLILDRDRLGDMPEL